MSDQPDAPKLKRTGNAAGKPKRKPKKKPQMALQTAKSEPVAAFKRADAPGMAARPKKRHWLLVFSFLFIVLLPFIATAWYLWERAEDQFASQLGFTVRREEGTSASELLGGLANFSSSGSSDTDVLYEFIQSQELVAKIDARLDLRTIYSAHVDTDPIFAFDPDGTVEDLVGYWRRMVKISYDAGSGFLELRVLAFDAANAHQISQTILEESSAMINGLSTIARDDATRYAQEDLDQAVDRLKDAREAITDFRSRTQIVDPSTVLQGQIGILNTLQVQLAESVIELDLLRESTRDSDPRITQVQRRINVIEARIEEERRKFSRDGQGNGDGDYATLVSEFERLTVDREFAEQTYTTALSAFYGARAEAQRQSRYLAPFIKPTIAERAEYPRRPTILALVTLFCFLTWAILSLVYYSLRDRK